MPIQRLLIAIPCSDLEAGEFNKKLGVSFFSSTAILRHSMKDQIETTARRRSQTKLDIVV
jgi:hypothetical protein